MSFTDPFPFVHDERLRKELMRRLSLISDADDALDGRLTIAEADIDTLEALIPAGSTTDATLRWDGSAWVQNTGLIAEAGGNVGIGETNPLFPLHITAFDEGIRLESSSDATYTLDLTTSFTDDAAKISVRREYGAGIRFPVFGRELAFDVSTDPATSGNVSEAMRITSAGLVGLGETAPDRVFHIKNAVPAIRLEDSDTAGLYSEWLMTAANELSIRQDEGNVASNSLINVRVKGNEMFRITEDRIGVNGQSTLEAVIDISSDGRGEFGRGLIIRGDTTVAGSWARMDFISETATSVTSGIIFQDGNDNFNFRNLSSGSNTDIEQDGTGQVRIFTNGSRSCMWDGAANGRAIFQAGTASGQTGLIYVDPGRGSGTSSAIWSNDIAQPFQIGKFNTSNAANFDVFSNGTGAIRFITGLNAEAARIGSSGSMGINVTNPTATHKLHIKAGSSAAGLITLLGADDRPLNIASPDTSSGNNPFRFATSNAVQFDIDGTAALLIGANGNTVIGNQPYIDAQLRITNTDANANAVALGASAGYTVVEENNSTGYGICSGVKTSGNGVIQVQNIAGSAVAYNLELQPLGGATLISGGAFTFTSGGNLSASGSSEIFTAGGEVASGRGSGETALTTNDSGGNANVTFNHTSRVPDVTGSSSRIVSSVDSSVSSLDFFLGDSTTSGVTVGLTSYMKLFTDRIYTTVGPNFLVGLTSSIAANDGQLQVNAGTGRACATFRADGNSSTSPYEDFILFRLQNNNGSGKIRSNGANSCAIVTFSDERLKKNIRPYEGALDEVMRLRPSRFQWRENDEESIGLIAQNVQEVWEDAVHEDAATGMLELAGVDKTDARLIAAIQELTARVEELEKRAAV